MRDFEFIDVELACVNQAPDYQYPVCNKRHRSFVVLIAAKPSAGQRRSEAIHMPIWDLLEV